jgi:hypothetical protein
MFRLTFSDILRGIFHPLSLQPTNPHKPTSAYTRLARYSYGFTDYTAHKKSFS